MKREDDEIDRQVVALGNELLRRMGAAVPGLFDTNRWEGKLLDWAMRDERFKVNLFRFIDVLPSLTTPEKVAAQAREYLLSDEAALTGIFGLTAKLAAANIVSGLTGRVVERKARSMARRFIAGRDPREALPALEALHRQGFAFTTDLLGEATLSDAEAATYAKRYLRLIEQLPETVTSWPEDDIIDRNHLGPLPRANVSMKISSLAPNLDCLDPAGGVARLKERILPLLVQARRQGCTVHLDLEQWELHQLSFDLFEELAAQRELRDWPHLGMTLQAYLKESDSDLERLISIAKARGTPIGVRLAKGAYWDTEVVRAWRNGTPCPVFQDKRATDARYEALTARLVENAEWVHAKFASHNLRSLVHAIVQAKEAGLPLNAIEAQTLFGMAEPERAALRQLGCRVRVYSPVGELLPGIAYLVRRLLENTSNQGFLRVTHHEHADSSSLLARPTPREEPMLKIGMVPDNLNSPFANCPLTDWTDADAREAMAQVVSQVRERLPVRTPVVIDGDARYDQRTREHPCPGESGLVATTLSLATPEDADLAVATAQAHWPDWRDRPLEERAVLLEALADRLERNRFLHAAQQVWEVGKPWREADADVAEAVDFCRYYARRAANELGPHPLDLVPGERNRMWYEGRGPTAVIAPWNFPLAILTGMATAALVAGNTVILKPAEQSGGVAYGLYRAMMEAGFPPGAVQFLPGIGEEVGARLARNPAVANIAFTGSRAVGLSLAETAGHTAEEQAQVKRVVCEMGGKNAVIVDQDADLDNALSGVLTGGFGYAGQKCSACSRVITVGAVHHPFVDRLVEAARSLPQLPPQDPACTFGPVVDREAFERLERLQRLLAEPGAGVVPLFIGESREGGYFIPAALYEVDDPAHRLMQEEQFGPVIAVHRVDTFEQALAVANDSSYALTGSVYSRTPSHLEWASKTFRVGNLYLNRTCTGAAVGRQPFGGFRMSGAGTKAGGPGYLRHFADPRTWCENTARHGFTPEVQV